MATGDLTLSWIRRARLNHGMRDGGDVPLGESSEAYEVDVLKGDTVVNTLSTSSQSVVYSAADQTTDFGSTQELVGFNVYQMGKNGRGYVGNYPIWKLLPGLVLSLRPDTMLPSVANGANLTKWFEQGPYKAHASEVTNPPTFVTNVQNGLPIVRFNGTTQKLTGAQVLDFPTEARTIYLVAKPTASNGVFPFISLTSGQTAGDKKDFAITPEFAVRASGAFREWLSGGLRFGTAGFHTLAVTMPAAGFASDLNAYYDGTALTVNTTTDAQLIAGLSPYTVGYWTSGPSFYGGDIGDIYVYNQLHTTGQRAVMQTYLKNRWATP